MEKIRKALSAIIMIIKNPWLLNKVYDDNAAWKNRVIKDYGLDSGLPVLDIKVLFPGFSDTLDSFSFSGGGSLPTDIALLRQLCKRKENPSYFEIGTWRGESVANVSGVAKKCYTLNLSPEKIEELSGSKEYADAHFFFSRDIPNVTQLLGDSSTFDFEGLNKKFDVIFIDGNHHYEHIRSDTEKVFKYLMKEDSVVVWHDYAYDPEQLRFETIYAILRGVPKDLHKHLYFVANTMSALFIKGDFNTRKFVPNSDPRYTFEVGLRTKEIIKKSLL